MDFTWEAMEAADQRVRHLRRRFADWGEPASELGEAAAAFDVRFREEVGNDLHLPGAVAVVSDLATSPDVPDAEKAALLTSWDEVLGIDIGREARTTWEPTAEMRALMTARDEARAEKDYATSDRLRDDLTALGVEVMDTPHGTDVRPLDEPSGTARPS